MNYCLMGTRNSYSDWHIDLGGTSVWYHIQYGGKIFVLVKPTPGNIRLYIGKELQPSALREWVMISQASQKDFN
jgi:hypothetical protein